MLFCINEICTVNTLDYHFSVNDKYLKHSWGKCDTVLVESTHAGFLSSQAYVMSP